MRSRFMVLSILLFLSGCLWPVQRETDKMVIDLSTPYDVVPTRAPANSTSSVDTPGTPARSGNGPGQSAATDLQTTALMMEADPPVPGRKKLDLEIPKDVPGSETPRVILSKDKDAMARDINRIYPELPPLPEAPKAQPGPGGRAYTLSDFQRLAADNDPKLRQFASDVDAARGNLIQAKTYQNPTVSLQNQANNANTNGGAYGFSVDQNISTGGKMRMQVAAAQKSLDNAELALRRARSDLSTAVRNAYFAFLVARETMAVNAALAGFTDMVYRNQIGLLRGSIAAPYEPASLRAQAFTVRLAHKQAITSYLYAWKQLVATLGIQQLPLSEVEGRIDRMIPYYDYDVVLHHALLNHTDVLTARNATEIGKYNLKLAQITPLFPDVEVNYGAFKDTNLFPYGTYNTLTLSVPVPVWDLNKGNIIAAQAALLRASEESHKVEVTLTNSLAAAYANYKMNLDGLEYYRKYILPDQVRAYRGVFERRQVDQNSPFGDLVQAQQTLTADVNNYLAILGSLWTAVVSVADFLQTDDLFQQSKPMPLPGLPALDQLPAWPCPHPGLVSSEGPAGACAPVAAAIPQTQSPGLTPAAARTVPAPATSIAAPARESLPTFNPPLARTLPPPSPDSIIGSAGQGATQPVSAGPVKKNLAPWDEPEDLPVEPGPVLSPASGTETSLSP